MALTGVGEPEIVHAQRVTSNFLSILGVAPALGRSFLPAENRIGGPNVVMLSTRLWRRRFGANPAILGHAITLAGTPYTIIGILPPRFDFPSASQTLDAWITRPTEWSPMPVKSRALSPYLHVFGRLKPGISIDQASEELAGRGRLLRQLLTESTLLSLLGGTLGTALAWIALRGIRGATAITLPRSSEIRLDSAVLAFALALSVATGILFGLAPAWAAFRRDLAAVLQGSAITRSGKFRRHFIASPRGLLVTGQVALSLVLLVSAGLLLQSLAHVYAVDPGYRPDHVLTMSVSLAPAVYDTDPKRAAFSSELVERVEAIPGVEHASVTLTLPATGWAGTPVAITGRPELPLNRRPIAVVQLISPGYFSTLAIPLQRGRAFTKRDNANAPLVAIIDESLARRFWPLYPRGLNLPGNDPIGQYMLMGSHKEPLQIIGIAASVHQQGRDTDPMPGFYIPNAQQPQQALMLMLRTKRDPATFAGAVRQQVLALDHNQPISEVRTLSSVVDASEDQRRLMFSLLGAFSITATLLAVLGLYSVISYSVVERTREIAIRQALGAQRSRILTLVLRQGIGLALGGIVIGIAGAAALTRLLSSMLFGVKAIDPVTFIVAAALFLVVALAASYIPARRAAAVDPMAALRQS
jgi:predicted permease